MKKWIILCLISLFVFLSAKGQASFFSREALKVNRVISNIDSYYVDSVDIDKLVEDVIIKTLHDLDPHSSYISPDEVARMNEPLEGNFEGIGISFNILDDTLYVVQTIPGGPSEEVGLKAGDRIIKVDNKNIAGIGLKNSDVFDLLRGKKGTKVSVTVKRGDLKKLLEFTITRDKIPIYSVDAAYKVSDETGYIKVNRFAHTTYSEFIEVFDSLSKSGMKNLILDLSDNGGGLLSMAVLLTDQFLDKGKLIVYTQGDNSPRYEYNASLDGAFEDGKLVIMINEGSASASEILSGAIQDWDRGVIVGRRSFGKGLVQRPFNLNDNSQIRLTVARYYTPTGRLIQKPYEDGYDDYAGEISKRFEGGEMMSADSIDFPDSLEYSTLKNKRSVYGGGGIMPDVFIPLDTTNMSDYYQDLIRKGVLYRFTLNFVDENRKKIKNTYTSFDNFRSDFYIADKQLNKLSEFAENEGIEVDKDGLEVSKNQIIILMKSYIARDIWSTSEFYEIYNQKNDAYLKAIKIIDDSSLYNKILGK